MTAAAQIFGQFRQSVFHDPAFLDLPPEVDLHQNVLNGSLALCTIMQ